MPQSTSSQPTSDDTTMSEHSRDSYILELEAESRRRRGLIATCDDQPSTNGHPLTNAYLTNGYHSFDESNTAEEVQMRSPAHRTATSNSGQPSNNIRTTRVGAVTETGAAATSNQTYVTGTTINGTNINDISINATSITGTTISGTRITGITLNGTHISQTTINGVPNANVNLNANATARGSGSGSETTITRPNDDINGNTTAFIERARAFTKQQLAVAADAEARIQDLERETEFVGSVAWTERVTSELEQNGYMTPDDPEVITGSRLRHTTKVYPRALFPNINPIKVSEFLTREFGDPWLATNNPPVWKTEVLVDGSYRVNAPRQLTDAGMRSCEGF